MQMADLRDRHRDAKNAQLSLNRRRSREAAGQGQMGIPMTARDPESTI